MAARAAPATVALCPVCCAVASEAGTILLGTEIRVTIAPGFRDACVAIAPESVIAIAACRRDTRTVASGIGILDSALAANQAMIPVVASVRQVVHTAAGFVGMPAAVRTEVSVRVITAVGTVVRVFARLVITVGVICAVGAIPGVVL